jgi:hypothetical protein
MQHMLPRFRKRATTTSVWPRRVVGMRSLLMQEVQVFICGYKKYVGSKTDAGADCGAIFVGEEGMAKC